MAGYILLPFFLSTICYLTISIHTAAQGCKQKKEVHGLHELTRISFKKYYYFCFNPCKSV